MIGRRAVLVTGALGFIGRATVAALVRAGWSVTIGVRSPGGISGTDSICLDLDKPDAILSLARDVRFDAIVHLGAHIGWPVAADSDMFVPNALSTGCLAFLARQWNAHLVFASAAIVCGAKTEMINADSPVSIDTAYGNSKWLGEQLIVASQVHHCILRIGGVFGGNGPAHLGMNCAISGAMKGEHPVQFGSGEALRNYIYVQDVAQAFVDALQQGLTGSHLMAGHEVLPVSKMLQQVCDVFMPGEHPVVKEGGQAFNQIITPSESLPKTRGFSAALQDILDGGYA